MPTVLEATALHLVGVSPNNKGGTTRHDKVWIGALVEVDGGGFCVAARWGARGSANPQGTKWGPWSSVNVARSVLENKAKTKVREGYSRVEDYGASYYFPAEDWVAGIGRVKTRPLPPKPEAPAPAPTVLPDEAAIARDLAQFGRCYFVWQGKPCYGLRREHRGQPERADGSGYQHDFTTQGDAPHEFLASVRDRTTDVAYCALCGQREQAARHAPVCPFAGGHGVDHVCARPEPPAPTPEPRLQLPTRVERAPRGFGRITRR